VVLLAAPDRFYNYALGLGQDGLFSGRLVGDDDEADRGADSDGVTTGLPRIVDASAEWISSGSSDLVLDDQLRR